MQKHEKKRVAGGASYKCLKTKGQICTHERGTSEVVSDSWRAKEEEKEMKWRRGEGVASVANTGLTGARFRICGNDWSYGRFFGSVANTGVSDILKEGRGRGRRGEKCCAAGAHGVQRGQAIKRAVPESRNLVYYLFTICQAINKSFGSKRLEWEELLPDARLVTRLLSRVFTEG